MAELRDEIAIYLCERFDGEDWEECSIEDNVTYQFNADSIIKLMLAKVEAALLTDKDWESVNQKTGYDIIEMIMDYSHNRINAPQLAEIINERCFITAKAQLQAIKDLLEGK